MGYNKENYHKAALDNMMRLCFNIIRIIIILIQKCSASAFAVWRVGLKAIPQGIAFFIINGAEQKRNCYDIRGF